MSGPPVPPGPQWKHADLRDVLAGMCMMAQVRRYDRYDPARIADKAYTMADAMLERRKEVTPNEPDAA